MLHRTALFSMVSLSLLCLTMQASENLFANGSVMHNARKENFFYLIESWSKLQDQQALDYRTKQVVNRIAPITMVACAYCGWLDSFLYYDRVRGHQGLSPQTLQNMENRARMRRDCVGVTLGYVCHAIELECFEQPRRAQDNQLQIQKILAAQYNLGEVRNLVKNKRDISSSCRIMLDNLHKKME